MRSHLTGFVLVLAATLQVQFGTLKVALAWTFSDPVKVSNETSTSAVITWGTDEPAPTEVKYMVFVSSPIIFDQQALLPGLTTTHSITLTGLVPNATYKAAVVLDEAGNPSVPVTFTTLNTTALLTVDFTGDGSGSVISSPGDGISCRSYESSDCSERYYTGASVTNLTAVGRNSTFSGWSEACPNPLDNPCIVTIMDGADKTVTASFTADPAKVILESDVSLTRYYSINEALDASGGKPLKARGVEFPEAVVMASPVSIKLKGGYNPEFTSQTGYTIINGSLRVQKGTLRVERMKVM